MYIYAETVTIAMSNKDIKKRVIFMLHGKNNLEVMQKVCHGEVTDDVGDIPTRS